MSIGYTVYHPDGRAEEHSAPTAGWHALHALITPIVGGYPERVAVLHEGKPLDMFVHETGALDGLPVNAAATKIYRNNWLTKHPGTDPETLPAIYGVAVLFHRRVWF